MYTAADWLIRLDDALSDETGISKTDYRTLLHNMSGIVSKINEHSEQKTHEPLVVITKIRDGLSIRSDYYVQTYSEKGALQIEEWFRYKGHYHRDGDKPALIRYYDNGNKRSERWLYRDHLHRCDDEPAVIFYYANGNVRQEEWFVNGEKHRVDPTEPTIVRYNNDGTVTKDERNTKRPI